MAHLPFHLVFLAIVMFIFQLFLKTDCRETYDFLQLFSVRNNNVVILDNGAIFTAAPAPSPSLYGLIRMQYAFNRSRHGDHNFTLEAVASRYHLCMNKTGKLYTQPSAPLKKERQERRKRRRENRNETRGVGKKGGKGKRERTNRNKTVNECLFRLYKLPLNESYYQEAIYSAAYSTSTMGRFIAFGKDGMPRSLKQPFAEVARHPRLGMLIQIHEPRNIERVIESTYFVKNKNRNIKIRKCILNHHVNSNIFSLKKSRHNKVSHVIQKCRRKYDPNYASRWPGSRKYLSQDSMQRNLTFS